ncbi:MAG: hypothetical protein U0Q07_12300 [Acidimicrobiales bacterium]
MTERRLLLLDRVAGWLALGAVAVPFLVNAVVSAGLDWHPVSDRAVIVARVADVLGGDTPLVGAYSRFGFNHPGPLGAYVLAPLWAARPQAGSVLAAGALVNGVAAVAAVAVVRRRAGTLPALGVAAMVLVLARSLGPVLVRDPWNPWLPVLPFLLFVVAVWAMATGSRWSLPLAVGAGSFVVQEHVGYVPVVAVLGVWGVVALAAEALAEHRRAGATPEAVDVGSAVVGAAGPGSIEAPFDRSPDAVREPNPPVKGSTVVGPAAGPRADLHDAAPWWLRGLVVGVVTAAVVVVVWGAPLRQQAAAPAGTGNLSLLVSHLRDDAPSGRPGLRGTLGITGREAAPWGPWIGGEEPADGVTGGVAPAGVGGLVALVVALVASLGLRWRRGPDAAARWVATALVGVGAGVLAVTRIDDGVFPYLIRWWWVLAAVGWFGVVWVLAAAAREVLVHRWPRAPIEPVAIAGLLAVVVVLSAIVTGAATSREVPDEQYDRAVAAVVGPVLDAVPAGAPVSVAAGGTDVGIVAGGLGWALEQAGRPLATGPGTAYIWGDVRADRTEPPPGRRLVVRSSQQEAGPVELPTGDEVLAAYDALDPAERAEVQRLRAEVDDALRAARARGPLTWDDAVDPTRVGVPAADVARLRDLLARSYQVVVTRPAGAPG